MLDLPRPGRSSGPRADAERVAEALDDVAIACSPHRDIAVNPAKMLAIALADANPLVWGGSVLAARAARRVAESIRRASGRTALAGDAEHLLPVIEAAAPARRLRRPVRRRPSPTLARCCCVLDDGADDPVVREQRGRLQAAAADARRPRRDASTTEAADRGRALRLAAAHAAPTPRSTSASASSRSDPRRRCPMTTSGTAVAVPTAGGASGAIRVATRGSTTPRWRW